MRSWSCPFGSSALKADLICRSTTSALRICARWAFFLNAAMYGVSCGFEFTLQFIISALIASVSGLMLAVGIALALGMTWRRDVAPNRSLALRIEDEERQQEDEEGEPPAAGRVQRVPRARRKQQPRGLVEVEDLPKQAETTDDVAQQQHEHRARRRLARAIAHPSEERDEADAAQ